MLKKILLIALFVLPFIFLFFSNRVVAEKECWDGPGGGPSISGNFQIPPGWRCQCPPEVALEFDHDSTADTMTSGGSIDVYIKGGSAPFTYTVTSGTGATWNKSGSTSHSSNNSKERLDLADGT